MPHIGFFAVTLDFSLPTFLQPQRFHKRSNKKYDVVKCTLYNGRAITPQLHKCATTFLKNKQGKYLKPNRRNELIAEDLQDGSLSAGKAYVDVWKQGEYFALCFKCGRDTRLLTVEGNQLKLRKTTIVAGLLKSNANCWFQMDNIGTGQYCIKTKTVPTKYLVINEEQRPNMLPLPQRVTLRDTPRDNDVFTMAPCQCPNDGCPGF